MRWGSGLLIVVLAAACGRAPESRQYEVRGQILGVDAERREVLVDHEDIEGFMPAMTMPYTVRDPALLEGREPGDLITATLVVEETSAYLSTMTTTGRAPIRNSAAMPAITAVDLLAVGDPVPGAPLVDQHGSPKPLPSFHGHRVALTFMYTRCPLPDFCPLMDRQFAVLQREIGSSPALADVRLVSVTLDPDFDTPDVLRTHAAAVGADPRLWTFATGPRNEVLALAKRFGVLTEPGEADGIVVHNLRTAVIDAEGRLASVHSGNMWTPADIVADLTKASAPAH